MDPEKRYERRKDAAPVNPKKKIESETETESESK